MTDQESSKAGDADALAIKLADRLKEEREYLGLSQEQVAKALAVSRAAVSAIETGRRKVSGIELAQLSKLYGTSVDRLLGSSTPADESVTQLFRATKELSENDKSQVLRFAEFLSNTKNNISGP
ncbi:hypothetical protein CH249_09965 [Rhodococcus sp. 05-2255-3B1]|uniref:helix-turn-helix transcriptional regulator n=1 Tax=unclassified Rhodococcus (in: high G+C Gram-positive bacteria) TaxID=192944 RepID=UPI000B9AF2DF|nr:MULTISPECIES: helix-turn-helix transcriptional regulator [unclassified Rhodococcus (in: high G+C Gram-positive bacteria)]OZE05143.1 hypothetical protein CH250_20280 [Rhodococcus sp. 05-2255-3C]OZE11783.1 hypothetical protein CH249_09965 [Rhodococcus sp. 05-2255-3B1]OZE24190.1 hypothetical protein CH255_02470 [Rhodococcus sp. 05-2255-2A2]